MKLTSLVFAGVIAVTACAAAAQPAPALPKIAAPPAQPITEAPQTPAKATYERLCTGCHESEIVESQRHTKSEWDETVHSMADRGMTATDAEIGEVIDYLAMLLPPQAPPK